MDRITDYESVDEGSIPSPSTSRFPNSYGSERDVSQEACLGLIHFPARKGATTTQQHNMNNNIGLICVAVVIDVLTLIGVYVLIGAHFAK